MEDEVLLFLKASRLIPFLSSGTLKLMSSPTFQPPSFVDWMNCLNRLHLHHDVAVDEQVNAVPTV